LHVVVGRGGRHAQKVWIAEYSNCFRDSGHFEELYLARGGSALQNFLTFGSFDRTGTRTRKRPLVHSELEWAEI
jgi:hypothetical protein